MRYWFERYPESLVPVAQRWNEMGLRLFKAHHEDYSFINTAFFTLAKTVKLAVSDQPLGLYETAMAGVLNDYISKRVLVCSCIIFSVDTTLEVFIPGLSRLFRIDIKMYISILP